MANDVQMPPVLEIEAREEQVATEGERFFIASQWNLMWWKFRKHKVAVSAAW